MLLMVVNLKITDCWDVSPCNLVIFHQCFLHICYPARSPKTKTNICPRARCHIPKHSNIQILMHLLQK